MTKWSTKDIANKMWQKARVNGIIDVDIGIKNKKVFCIKDRKKSDEKLHKNSF